LRLPSAEDDTQRLDLAVQAYAALSLCWCRLLWAFRWPVPKTLRDEICCAFYDREHDLSLEEKNIIERRIVVDK
jgi:hypothetical protein